MVDLTNRPSQFVLFGCSVETCLEYSRLAIEFYVSQSNQMQIERSENEKNVLRQRANESESRAKEAQFQYDLMRRQIEQLEAEKDQYKTELLMLTDRYNNKSQQKRKLEELYSDAKFNNAVERSNAMPAFLPGRTSGSSNSSPRPSLGMSLSSSSSVSGSGTRMNVQQTLFKLSDEPNKRSPQADRFALLRRMKTNQPVSPSSLKSPLLPANPSPKRMPSNGFEKSIPNLTNSANQHSILGGFAGRTGPLNRPQRPNTPSLNRRNGSIPSGLLGTC